MRLCLLITLGLLGGCHDDTGPRASDAPESTCEAPALVAQAGPALGVEASEADIVGRTPIAYPDWLGIVVNERRGDWTTYCHDCNDTDLGFCDMCAHSVLTLEVGTRRIELDRWYPGPGMGGLVEVAPVQLAGGDLVVVWQRRLGQRGISPSEGRFARVTAAGDVIVQRSLYESEPGLVEVVAHDTDDLVAVIRHDWTVFARVGVHVAVVGDTPDIDWTQSGSSLANTPSATPFGKGFLVAYSDQAVDTLDRDCAPCQTFEDCFRTLVRESGGGGPAEGCVSFSEASPSAGLQVVRVDGDGVSSPVQLATGWYDRVYGGEEQRLYADHGKVALRASPGRLEYVGVRWDADPIAVHVEFDLATGSRMETPLPLGLDGEFVFDDTAIWWVGWVWDGDTTPIEAVARDGCGHAVVDVVGYNPNRPFAKLEDGALRTVVLRAAASGNGQTWHPMVIEADLECHRSDAIDSCHSDDAMAMMP